MIEALMSKTERTYLETKHRLYHEWLVADEEFAKALVRAYGARRYPESRYMSSHPGHPEVTQALERWRAAGDRYLSKTN